MDPQVDPHPAVDPLPGPGADPLLLSAADGGHPIGAATIDSDADGLPDTALVPSPARLPGSGDGGDTGALLGLATDLDHDGDVDVLTTLTAEGTARTVALDAPAGRWQDAADDGAGPDPRAGPTPDTGWDAGWDAAPPPAPALDPRSGRWTRSS